MNLKAARTRAGLTQDHVARHIGVTKQAISDQERGLYAPDEQKLEALAALYQTTPSELRYGRPGHMSAAVTDGELVTRFLQAVKGVEKAVVSEISGVRVDRILRWRDLNPSQLLALKLDPSERVRLTSVVERLETQSGAGREISLQASYDAGYAAAVFEMLAIDAKRIMERALEAKARMDLVAREAHRPMEQVYDETYDENVLTEKEKRAKRKRA